MEAIVMFFKENNDLAFFLGLYLIFFFFLFVKGVDKYSSFWENWSLFFFLALYIIIFLGLLITTMDITMTTGVNFTEKIMIAVLSLFYLIMSCWASGENLFDRLFL